MKTINALVIVISLFAILASCEKSETYPEGGEIKDAETNIKKDWYLESYLRNTIDNTDQVFIRNYTENYDSQGVYSRSYIKSDETQILEDGAYSFTGDMYELRISDVSSISDFSDQNSTLSSSTYQILKLTQTEYWYSFVNGSEKHEFRFSSNMPALK